jgi:hypothetical protein
VNAPTPPSNAIKHYSPHRRRGALIHGALIAVSIAVMIVAIIFLFQTQGVVFVAWLLVMLPLLIMIPLLISRLFGLIRSDYTVSRDFLVLQWGNRLVKIPIQSIEWVRSFDSLGLELKAPRFFRSGIVRDLVSSEDLGWVEYLSDNVQHSLFVATPERVYAISPVRIIEFSNALSEAIESGSLLPAEGVSIEPETIFTRLWQNPSARLLILSLIGGNLALLIIVQLMLGNVNAMAVFSQQSVITPVSLQLLPFWAVFLAIIDLLLGLFLYRKQIYRMAAYFLWGAGAVLPVLLALSIALIS